MPTVMLSTFGKVISDSELGDQVRSRILELLSNNHTIDIDMAGVISMATFCSKQIFGQLYIDLGPKSFFERIRITNASDDMRVVIRLGIEKALESIKSE